MQAGLSTGGERVARDEVPGLEDAWRSVFGTKVPAHIAPIHRKRKSRVFRIPSVDVATAVIAKNCTERVASVERRVHEGALRGSGLPVAGFLGWSVDPTAQPETDLRTHWLFFEDLGERRFEPADANQRGRLAEWLGAFAAVTTRQRSSGQGPIPVRGVRYYEGLLDRSLVSLPYVSRRTLPSVTRTNLDRVVSLLADIRARWNETMEVFSEVPVGLVHGDCVAKNIHVTGDGSVIPIDWGSAGWGPPGIDLGVSAIRWGSPPAIHTPDSHAYGRAFSGGGNAVDTSDIGRLAAAGRLCYLVKLISQSVPTFEHASKQKLSVLVSIYGEALDLALGPLEWGPVGADR